MASVPIRRYKLSREEKQDIMSYLAGEMTQPQLARNLNTTTQGIYTRCTAILKHVVQSGKGVEEALNDY